ncbi:MAG: hypothetical protein JJE21_07460 [Spirochaetaceae bacterium]|nr:hypothetical protein [Spirochaetaceae bacterium]
MDIRRVKLTDHKNATVLSNDLIRAIIQDHNGRVIELSATNIHGGWVNCNKLHKFPFSKETVLQDVFNYDKTSRLTELLYGCQLHVEEINKKDIKIATKKIEDIEESIPNNLDAMELGDVLIERDLNSKKENKNHFVESLFEADRVNWVVQRYGSDQSTGGAWVLSVNDISNKGNKWNAKRLEIIFPNQPVLYSVTYVKNISNEELSIDMGFDNSLGSPLLESGCVINSSAALWRVAETAIKEVTNTRIVDNKKIFSLDKAPVENCSYSDIRIVPGIIGTTDVICGQNNPKDKMHQWISVINPRQQMVYLSFTPGPDLTSSIDITLPYSNLVLDFGGRERQPWSVYDGGTCNEFALHASHSTTNFGDNEGIILAPGEIKRSMVGRALISYDNIRMGNNFYTFESFNHNIVLKRTKSNIVIPSDPKFEKVKKLCDRIIVFENT